MNNHWLSRIVLDNISTSARNVSILIYFNIVMKFFIPKEYKLNKK